MRLNEMNAKSWDGIWIAIPAYNEARTIRELSLAALSVCPRVVVVDDGSIDQTSAAVKDLPIALIRHEQNCGKAASLRTAFRHVLDAGGRAVITLDGDGQHDPMDAPRLLDAWLGDPSKLVVGSRLHDRAQFPPARYRANRFACFWISWAAGHPIADSQSGFRLYPPAAMQLALSRVRSSRFTFESEILIEAAWVGMTTMSVAIPGRYPTSARASHFRPVIDIAKIVIMVAGRLLRKGMAPVGLWRSLTRRPAFHDPSARHSDHPRPSDPGAQGISNHAR